MEKAERKMKKKKGVNPDAVPKKGDNKAAEKEETNSVKSKEPLGKQKKDTVEAPKEENKEKVVKAKKANGAVTGLKKVKAGTEKAKGKKRTGRNGKAEKR
jgi:hypothetical protein